MRIDVTQDDIDKGVPGQCEKCPVAIALARQPQVWGAVVEDDGIQLILANKPDGWTGFPMKEEVGRFVMNFDEGVAVQPFSFDLDL